MGYALNILEPKTFNEKIHYRKKNGNFSVMALYADKYVVRDYVKEKIGDEYLIPLIGVYDSLSPTDFKTLPKKFVIKTNHGSGNKHISIVEDKDMLDIHETCKKFNTAIKESFGLATGEYFYTKIKKKILIEEYLDMGLKTPDDYKFHCFNGKNGIKIYIQLDRGRFGDHKRNIYNENWELLNFHFDGVEQIGLINKPENLSQMLFLAKRLASDFDYIRVDLYNINGKIYFGELTQTHNNGMAKKPLDLDCEWGDYWEINNKLKIYKQ